MNNEPFDTLYPPPVFTFRLFRLGDNYSDTGGAEGIDVSVSKLCRWFGLPRRSWYYRSVKAAPKLQEH
ncbi:hypothetical protein, partial [Aeromonas caviae]|uniref:hypothetical protein n=1 Tax=Aeromonas caviae TaxID=648 RepID=UPI0040393B71